MINAKELRIGNYAFGRNCKGELVIDQVEWIQDEDHANGMFQIVEGIPLSENVLLACGFEKDEKRHYYMFTPCGKGFVWKDCYSIFFGTTIETPIIYLHQLQNLYFALTGHELPIDLTKLQEKEDEK